MIQPTDPNEKSDPGTLGCSGCVKLRSEVDIERLQNRALVAAMREALMRPENWREAINTALNDLDKER